MRRATLDWEATHPGLKAKIDQAVARTASKSHYFWTGWYEPAAIPDNSAMNHAVGTTLDQTVQSVSMPGWDNDTDAEDIWNYASDLGEIVRGGNVWVAFEYKRLKTLSPVKRIMEIKTHRARDENSVQVWPDVVGCDGVSLLDKHIECPPNSKLYFSIPKQPAVTSETTVAKDATIKISTSGSAPGIRTECTEILWVFEQFQKSKACEAATKKNNGGTVMAQVKVLLTSSQNRHLIQQQRLAKVKEKVTGPPIPGILERQLLDSNTQTAGLLRQIDTMVTAATGVNPGLSAAWVVETAIQKPAKIRLLVLLEKQMAQKKKEAQEAAKRTANCSKSKLRCGLKQLSGMATRSKGYIPARLLGAPRSGPTAPACPLKTAPQKKVVPRSKTNAKHPPAKTPRPPAKRPANKNKKVVPRPASRARRTPGKPKPTRRTTPKRKPKKVPKPTRRPKGKARSRKTRHK
ncbi:hypothetical protein BKA62DRAFT_741283 [Auriculariales sp. MPI-PUGE-AT-0066]|nr:hypothetical protein BKA62DRAFT_741283 [Auriculariales sp. MPI-PUGE-AT-0066]